MGCCSSILIEDDSEPGYGGRKILALKRHRWKAPVPPPTRTQLEREREEFWDTAPIYDGRAEVWQALKAVCCDTENDPDQLQAILDEARITVPSYVAPELTAAAAGNIDGTEGGGSASRRSRRNQRQDPMAHLACYDHLGNLYVVPLKILSDPGNLVENSGLGGSGGEGSSGGNGRDATQSRREQQQQQHSDNLVVPAEQQGQETTIRIRVSNSQKEVSLSVPGPHTTIGQIKARLVEGGFVRSEKSFMRVLFLGRVLEDKERLEGVVHFQVGVQGTVLQVLVSDP